MKKLFYLFMISTIGLFANELTPNYSFSNINLNYLNWNQHSEKDSSKGDYSYIGLESGMGWNNVDFYGFINIENPTKSYKNKAPNDLRVSSFFDLDTEIKSGFKFHIQNFITKSDTFYANDFVVGFAYKLDTDFGLWFRPFLGLHQTNDTYYDGLNGYMGGWLFNYNFELLKYKFNIFQWNEIEFERKKSFYLDNNSPIGDGASWGLNGAISIWIKLNESITNGIQYRYAKNKLGHNNYQSGIVYSIKYSF